MSEILQTDTTKITSQDRPIIAELSADSLKVRVSPNSYFIAMFLLTFFTGFLIYLELDVYAAILAFFSWILVPLALWTDYILFDGKSLIRTGVVPRIWAIIIKSEYQLSLEDIEQIETQALRALKRGGSVFYRYRTAVSGGSLKIIIASGGENYRRLVKSLFPLVAENVLDNRSIELRDYLSEPKETLMKAEFAKVPSTEVLENSLNEFENPKVLIKKNREKFVVDVAEDSEKLEKAVYLRNLANELRLSGNLLQALEVFRRALFLNPKSGWLLFEFARCLHSFAGAEKNPKLEHKALAALRLAEKRADGDEHLLARLGESYFQYGEWEKARKVFQRTLDVAEESFRSVRGMAEVSLREGKIAHVIHHFATANRLAETPALRRWTQTETDYFSRLNTDVKYMDMEVSRVNLLENLERGKRISLKIALSGLPWIIVGMVSDAEMVINLGWAISCVSLLIWAGMIMSRNIFSARVPLNSE